MSAYKYIIGLAVLVTVLLTINTVSATGSVASSAPSDKSQHHLTVGVRMPNDRLVLKEGIIKNSDWKNQIVVKTFHISKLERITMVEALDQKINENIAYARILQGGPGHSSVTIKFTSLRGHGINFIVQLYALP